MKRYWLFPGLVMVVGLVLVVISWVVVKDDYRYVVLNEDGVKLINVSPRRRSVFKLSVGPEVKIWIPGGMGWYRAGSLNKLLENEGKKSLVADIFFYNFGFEESAGSRFEGWRRGWEWWWNSRLVLVESELAKDERAGLAEEVETLIEVGLADEGVAESGLNWKVFNGSEEKGFADFVAKRLNYFGLRVIDVGNFETLEMERCRLLIGSGNKDAEILLGRVNRFLKCKIEAGAEEVERGEVRLVVGEGLAKMIEYSSYVGSF